jgi:cation diffusion facilitator CzcD-associated flavoprotein CzcO
MRTPTPMPFQRRDLPFRQVVITGAGLAGLDMGCELKRKLNFHDFVIFDRNPALGRT